MRLSGAADLSAHPLSWISTEERIGSYLNAQMLVPLLHLQMLSDYTNRVIFDSVH